MHIADRLSGYKTITHILNAIIESNSSYQKKFLIFGINNPASSP
jgi:hypothetical protein